MALIKKLKIKAMLTKESGRAGGLDIKIQAAISANIPLFILEIPEIPKVVQQIYDLQQL